MSLCLYVGGAFEPNEFVFLDAILERGMTFVDGGANDGIYSLFAARRVGPGGTVLAVEPSGREHRRLLANLERNPDMRVIPVRAALGRAPGEALLAVAEVGHEGQNTIGESVSNPKVATAKHETVPMTTLDGLVEEHGLARVDVVKLDVEGSEVDALLGARKTIERFHPVIQIEAETERLASQGRTKDELRQLLDELDYGCSSSTRRAGNSEPHDLPTSPRETRSPCLPADASRLRRPRRRTAPRRLNYDVGARQRSRLDVAAAGAVSPVVDRSNCRSRPGVSAPYLLRPGRRGATGHVARDPRRERQARRPWMVSTAVPGLRA